MMMNKVYLKGIIQNTKDSHTIQDIEFSKATMVVRRDNGKEDCLNIRFKKYSNPYQDNQEVSITGNLRSYSSRGEDGKNKVELYVFTYFDIPESLEDGSEATNYVELDGRICKIEPVRKTKDGKSNVHLIIANNMLVSNGAKRLNSYIPCIAWGKVANELSTCGVNTKVKITGEMHSREYKKTLSDGTIEIRVAHECVIKSFDVL